MLSQMAMAMVSKRQEGEFSIRSRGWIPHIEKQGATYFVTFRLADSLPARVTNELRRQRRNLEESEGHRRPDATWHLTRAQRKRIEKALDTNHGACWLKNEPVAKTVAAALRHFDRDRYALGAWCVMPNHVHVGLQPGESAGLGPVVHSWKSFTAQEANKLLGRNGRFWQREYYDHVVRDMDELKRTWRYILQNPARAGLPSWRWVGEGSLRELLGW
jgi:REP element-mobilizing transposase RayT